MVNIVVEIFSHVKWFAPSQLGGNEFINASQSAWIILAVLASLVALVKLEDSKLYKAFCSAIETKTKNLRSFTPTIVRLVAGSLLILGPLSGYCLAPDIYGFSGQSIYSLLFIAIGMLFIAGLFVRIAAISLIVLWAASFSYANAITLIEHLEYVGIGIYLALRGGARYSLDNKLKSDFLSSLDRWRGWSLGGIRVPIGISFVVLAFSEKLFNLDLAKMFLAEYEWNILSFAGVSDEFFIIIAGTIELILGIGLAMNIASRAVVLALLGMMLTTAVFLGVHELLGHLFAIALATVVLVNDIKPKALASTNKGRHG